MPDSGRQFCQRNYKWDFIRCLFKKRETFLHHKHYIWHVKIQNSFYLETIVKYFPGLAPQQFSRLAALHDLYSEWNVRINVISRKDMDDFYLHHVLHSMALMKLVTFKPGTRLLDVGTGGGFPGIPLAICFPECEFLLADSIGKKIKVVQAVAGHLQLKNVTALQLRAEEAKGQFDFIVSRAVTALPQFWSWVKSKIKDKGFNDLTNGVLYLKGGDFEEELKQLNAISRIYAISDYFSEDYFSTKKVVHICNRSSKNFFDNTNNRYL